MGSRRECPDLGLPEGGTPLPAALPRFGTFLQGNPAASLAGPEQRISPGCVPGPENQPGRRTGSHALSCTEHEPQAPAETRGEKWAGGAGEGRHGRCSHTSANIPGASMAPWLVP